MKKIILVGLVVLLSGCGVSHERFNNCMDVSEEALQIARDSVEVAKMWRAKYCQTTEGSTDEMCKE